jgi:hypothetical protein
MALSKVTRTTRRTMPGIMAGKADATATDPPGSTSGRAVDYSADLQSR